MALVEVKVPDIGDFAEVEIERETYANHPSRAIKKSCPASSTWQRSPANCKVASRITTSEADSAIRRIIAANIERKKWRNKTRKRK